jgi:hypothetical protein
MSLSFPRTFALLVGLWSVRLAYLAWTVPGGRWFLGGMAACWVLAAVLLWQDRRTGLVSLLVAGLAVAEYLLFSDWGMYALIFLAWVGVIAAACQGRPEERALLLRVLVSVVYGFAALTKVQPWWWAGDNLLSLARARGQAAFLEPLLHGPLLPVVATAVILTEAVLALGMWHRRTRAATAVLGVLLHLCLWAPAVQGVDSGANLAVLNFGLVALYPSFWHRVPARRNMLRPQSVAGSTAPPGQGT